MIWLSIVLGLSVLAGWDAFRRYLAVRVSDLAQAKRLDDLDAKLAKLSETLSHVTDRAGKLEMALSRR